MKWLLLTHPPTLKRKKNTSYLAINNAVPLIKSVARLGETWQINFQLGWNVYQP